MQITFETAKKQIPLSVFITPLILIKQPRKALNSQESIYL